MLASPLHVLVVCTSPNCHAANGNRETGQYKVFVACSGAELPRPVTLKKNDQGLWKASEWSSLLVGVMPPMTTPGDDL